MNQYTAGALGATSGGGIAGQLLYPLPTVKQRLETAILQAEERLRAVKEAKEIFDNNPDVERLLILYRKCCFR